MRKTTRVWDGTIILVADPSNGPLPTNAFDRRIDQPLAQTVDAIEAALRKCCKQVLRYSDLSKFTEDISNHPDCIVFPYWFGQNSRSRHGLVPAICEATDVMYVGGDAFTKVVCNDKELSKAICHQAGLITPKSALITHPSDFPLTTHMTPPVVVKPNYEGTSLGISQRNLCHTRPEAEALCYELYNNLNQPIIIEEFIEGREFSACIIGNQHETPELKIGAWVIDNDPSYLNKKLNTFDLKLPSDKSFKMEDIINLFEGNMLSNFLDCFASLGKVEILRIDGRINDRGPVVLELTPDIYLGHDGEFCEVLGYSESTFNEFISRIVFNCIKGYESYMPM